MEELSKTQIKYRRYSKVKLSKLRSFKKNEYLSQREYAKRNPEKINGYLKKERNATVEALGGKCIQCGFDDKRALQIDHIDGGGSKERKERNFKGSFNKHVLQSFLKGENKYQLLCANCNWIKRSVNNEMNKSKK